MHYYCVWQHSRVTASVAIETIAKRGQDFFTEGTAESWQDKRMKMQLIFPTRGWNFKHHKDANSPLFYQADSWTLFHDSVSVFPNHYGGLKWIIRLCPTMTSTAVRKLDSCCKMWRLHYSFECFYFSLAGLCHSSEGCVHTCVWEGDYDVMTSAGVRAEPEKLFRHSNLHKQPFPNTYRSPVSLT